MKITDLNAENDIGSNCLYLEIGPFRVLIDCGVHPKKSGKAALPVLDRIPDKTLDFIILTHCHLDHVGALPLVLKRHPRARVICSPASSMLVKRILRNSVTVMLRQREETGVKDYPFYTYEELDRVEAALLPFPLRSTRTLKDRGSELSVTLYPAGHVAGAVGALIEHKGKRHFFTGDVLFRDQLTIKGAAFPRLPLDTLVTETTRGATPHHEDLTRESETIRLLQSVRDTIDSGGSILIAAFAFGRMQEVLMMLHEAWKEGTLPKCPVFCSGLGVDLADYFDMIGKKTGTVKFRTTVMREIGARPLRGKFVEPGIDIQERGIYILSSGMLVENTPAWRISANLLDHPKNTIAFVGYCDPTTPGGRLLEAKPGDPFEYRNLEYTGTVNAKIERFHMSGHADREELLQFARDTTPKHLVMTHGDPDAREWFGAAVKRELPGTKVTDPVPGVTFEV